MTGCLEEGFLPQIAGDYMAVFSVSFVSSVGHLQLRIVVLYTIKGPRLVISVFSWEAGRTWGPGTPPPSAKRFGMARKRRF